MSHPFETHVREVLEAALLGFPAEDRQDIYVVSLLVDYQADEQSRPVVTVGYNTESSARESTPTAEQEIGWPVASTEGEARWNFAFFLQNEEGTIADPEGDPESIRLRDRWLADRGFLGEEHDWQDLERSFAALLVDAVRDLHARGVVERALGRPVPLMIHDLELTDDTVERTERANPPGLAAGLRAELESHGSEYDDPDFIPPPDEDGDAFFDEEDVELEALVARADFVVYAAPGARQWCGASELEGRLVGLELECGPDATVVESGLADPEDEPEGLARTALWQQLWQGTEGMTPETAERQARDAMASQVVLVLDGTRVTGVGVGDGDAWAIAVIANDESVVVRGRGARPNEFALEAAG